MWDVFVGYTDGDCRHLELLPPPPPSSVSAKPGGGKSFTCCWLWRSCLFSSIYCLFAHSCLVRYDSKELGECIVPNQYL